MQCRGITPWLMIPTADSRAQVQQPTVTHLLADHGRSHGSLPCQGQCHACCLLRCWNPHRALEPHRCCGKQRLPHSHPLARDGSPQQKSVQTGTALSSSGSSAAAVLFSPGAVLPLLPLLLACKSSGVGALRKTSTEISCRAYSGFLASRLRKPRRESGRKLRQPVVQGAENWYYRQENPN